MFQRIYPPHPETHLKDYLKINATLLAGCRLMTLQVFCKVLFLLSHKLAFIAVS